MLYGAARRVAKEMGYRRIVTYTLPAEGWRVAAGRGLDTSRGNKRGGRGSVRRALTPPMITHLIRKPAGNVNCYRSCYTTPAL